MRKHGWQPPLHPLQTVAIAVFCTLAFSFYVFFAPFLGSRALKALIMGLFSPLVGAVFILYVACTWINPVDPLLNQSKRKCSPTEDADERSVELRNQKKGLNNGKHRTGCSPLGCFQRQSQELDAEGELLYCSICDADISAYSKHCRTCDKCVHGFDHHCLWLNNCVGTRNYKPFVALMVSCLLMLIMECAVGIVVLVRCFINQTSSNQEISDQLGRSFPRAAFITVLVALMLLAFSVTAPLMQLFCFHLALMHKGITTYDYILTVREENQELSDNSSLTTSTETGNSYNSYNSPASKRIVLCTPPRLFVDQDQSVTALSDQEVGGGKARITNGKANQRVPGLNPWRLAAMNREDATRATARARAKSSILHTKRPEAHDVRSPSAGEVHLAGNRLRKPPSTLNSSLESLPANSFPANEEFTGDPALHSPFAPQFEFPTEQFPQPVTSDVVRVSVSNDGYEASCGESGDDTTSGSQPEPWVARFESPVSSGSRVEASILKANPELRQARLQSSSSPSLYEESALRESTESTTTSYGETTQDDRRTVSTFFYSGPESAYQSERGVSQRMPVSTMIALSRAIHEPKL